MSEAILTTETVVLECRQLAKAFRQGDERLEVLREITLEIRRGERLAVVGSSGSGKSTLLHLLGGLDTPTAGSVWLAGQDVYKRQLLGLRRLVEIKLGRGEGAEYADLRALHCISTQMLNSAARYRCGNCGFVLKSLHWCCPSCQQWNTIKPMPDLVMKTTD